MKDSNQLTNTILQGLKTSTTDSTTPAGQVSTQPTNSPLPAKPGEPFKAKPTQNHIKAMNQLFAELETAYHNQFYKAFPSESALNAAKQAWLFQLAHYHPEQIIASGRQVIRESEYLPTLHKIIQGCATAAMPHGMPSTREAYIEACMKPQPKRDQTWSHPAVYIAGRETGWHMILGESEKKVLPIFSYHYQMLVERVINGEDLDMPIPKALPAHIDNFLSPEENKAQMQKLRESLKV